MPFCPKRPQPKKKARVLLTQPLGIAPCVLIVSLGGGGVVGGKELLQQYCGAWLLISTACVCSGECFSVVGFSSVCGVYL